MVKKPSLIFQLAHGPIISGLSDIEEISQTDDGSFRFFDSYGHCVIEIFPVFDNVPTEKQKRITEEHEIPF